MSAAFLSSRSIIGSFYMRLAELSGIEWINLTSMLFQSDQESETYKWLGMSPAMREWVGGRNAKGFRENGITIVNKMFESTIEVSVNDLRRDKSGQVIVRINDLARRTNEHWYDLLTALIVAAETTACYDGQFFFDADHVEGDSGSQSNDITSDVGTTTAPTAAEMELAIFASIAQILSFKDDQGKSINRGANAFRILVPVPFMASALAAVRSATIVDGSGSRQNVLAQSGFSLNVDVNSDLGWTTKFATFRTDGDVKPFIRQEEEPVKLDAIAEGSELEFRENKHNYGVHASRNVGYGYWQHACSTTLV